MVEKKVPIKYFKKTSHTYWKSTTPSNPVWNLQKLPKQCRIYDIFYMLLLKQDITRKKRAHKTTFQLELTRAMAARVVFLLTYNHIRLSFSQHIFQSSEREPRFFGFLLPVISEFESFLLMKFSVFFHQSRKCLEVFY